MTKQKAILWRNKPGGRVARHKSNRGELDQHKTNAIHLPDLQNHFVFVDQGLSLVIQPAIKTRSTSSRTSCYLTICSLNLGFYFLIF